MLSSLRPRTSGLSFLLATGLCLCGFATQAAAIRLFPSPPRNGGEAISSTDLQLDEGAARTLAAQEGRVLIEAFPLADGRRIDFLVEPLAVFTKDAQAYEFDGVRRTAVPLPDVKVFEGTAVEDPSQSLILTVVDSKGVWALGRSAQKVTTLIGPSASASSALSHQSIDPATAAARHQERALCDGAVASPGQPERKVAARDAGRLVSDTLLEVELLVDVGNHLYTGAFGSSSGTASTYMAQLMGAVAAVYRRDTRVVPKVQTLVIWTTPEPFASTSTGSQLSGYRSYNETNRVGQPRDLAHYVDSLGSGGVAYLPGVCGAYGYGVSNIDGDVTFPVVGYEWDVNVIAHELGHNLGSNHTHCYDPPIDRCWNSESGCYRGGAIPQVGETMSYCHLVASIQMGFQGFIGNVIRETVETAACVTDKAASCGDGVIDAGEACDDGNVIDGDCCSSACALTGVENVSCSDGQYCTIDYACPNATCLSQPRLCEDNNLCTMDFCNEETNQCTYSSREGAACDDGLFCTSNDHCESSACTGGATCGDDNACTTDTCDEGLHTCSNSTAAPSATCRQAGASSLSIKNSLEDSKDSLQWKWKKGEATSHADFLSPEDGTDYSFCLYDENDQLVLQADAPAGGVCGSQDCWREKVGRGFKYKDRELTPSGTQALALGPGEAGKAKVSVKAKGLDLTGLTLPLGPTSTLRAQLRNDDDGTCFESTFVFPFTKNTAEALSAKE